MSEETPPYGTEEMQNGERKRVLFDYNRVMIGGRLTNNPELRYTPTGTAVCDFSIASNETRKDKEGNKHEEVLFIEIQAWGKLAELCSQYIAKGSAVFVEGRLKLDCWETNAGEKRKKIFIRADSIHFLDRKSE